MLANTGGSMMTTQVVSRPRAGFPGVPPAIRARMARIKKRHTKPELLVRRCAHRLGCRFRLHRTDLPGTPDIVFPSLRKVILVNGCFWHQHTCALGRKKLQTRLEYWGPKLARNIARDRLIQAELQRQAWAVLVIWECETRDQTSLSIRLRTFLGDRQKLQGQVRYWEDHNSRLL
jgi:DNA mismatch endonuclease (patch repair protein)